MDAATRLQLDHAIRNSGDDIYATLGTHAEIGVVLPNGQVVRVSRKYIDQVLGTVDTQLPDAA